MKNPAAMIEYIEEDDGTLVIRARTIGVTSARWSIMLIAENNGDEIVSSLQIPAHIADDTPIEFLEEEG